MDDQFALQETICLNRQECPTGTTSDPGRYKPTAENEEHCIPISRHCVCFIVYLYPNRILFYTPILPHIQVNYFVFSLSFENWGVWLIQE
jgi:hypothetical protein